MTGNAWRFGQFHDIPTLSVSRMKALPFTHHHGSCGQSCWRIWVKSLGCVLLLLGVSPFALAALLMATEIGGGHELQMRVDEHGLRHMVFHHPKDHPTPHQGVESLLWGKGSEGDRDHDWTLGSSSVPGCSEKESLELPLACAVASDELPQDFVITWKAVRSLAPPVFAKSPDPWWTGWAVMLI